MRCSPCSLSTVRSRLIVRGDEITQVASSIVVEPRALGFDLKAQSMQDVPECLVFSTDVMLISV